MIEPRRTLFTGGSGLLGRAFRALLPDLCYPSSSELDVTDYRAMERFLEDKGFDLLIHAAAFTSPPRIDQSPEQAIETNIIGTANIVRLCRRFDIKLVYISTDYVFRGERGNYTEDDDLFPVNKYAWSKLGGECAVRLYGNSLIVRTSFGPDRFPYPAAFSDQWTSRQPVSVAARQIIAAIERDLSGVIHIGGPRRTVLNYARSLDPDRDIKPLSIDEVDFRVPVDTSLCTERFRVEVGEQE